MTQNRIGTKIGQGPLLHTLFLYNGTVEWLSAAADVNLVSTKFSTRALNLVLNLVPGCVHTKRSRSTAVCVCVHTFPVESVYTRVYTAVNPETFRSDSTFQYVYMFECVYTHTDS